MARQRDIVYEERDKILKNEVNYEEVNIKKMEEIIHILLGNHKSHMNLTPDMYETIQGNFADMKFALPLPDKTENELYEMDILDLEEELKDIVDFCKLLSLQVIPEIEFPAHAVNLFPITRE